MPQKPRKPHCDKSQCPVAHALDIVGDPWTLIIVREMLMNGKHEFKEFMETPEEISTNSLSDRLKKLECSGLIRCIAHPQYKTRKLYFLTPSGKDLIHVIIPLAAWAERNLSSVDLPPEIAKELRNNSKGVTIKILQHLKEWEEEYLVDT